MSSNLKFDCDMLSSPANMLFAGQLSELSYQDESTIRLEVTAMGVDPEGLHFLYGVNIFGFVAKFDQFAFIVFRGSHTLGDWISNFDIRTFETFCGEIHYGFASTLDSISRDLIQEIASTFDKPYKLCLAGHSRGGALAVLAAAVLKESGHTLTAIYTFGQPKVGGKSFIEWWEKNISAEYVRVVNGMDIVPSLPPGIMDVLSFPILFPILFILLIVKLIFFPFIVLSWPFITLWHKIQQKITG